MSAGVEGVAPATPLWRANTAREEAAKLRAEWLVGLDAGLVSLADLFAFAATSEGRPLLRIPLRQVLLSAPSIGSSRAPQILARVQSLLGVEMPVRKMTIAWLLDSRTGGRRFMAWVDSTEISRSEPWSGFPYAPPPESPGAVQKSPVKTGGLT